MTLDSFATTFSRQFTPGPGSYSTENYPGVGDRYSIKCNIRPKYTDRPPLTSEIDYPKEYSSLTKKGKTIGPKYAPRHIDGTPGPEFLPNPREQFSKSVRIKNRYADPNSNMYPGPGTYSPGDLSKTKVPPMVGRSKIILSDIPDSPGPAAYDVLHKIGEAPKYTIRPKTAPIEDRSLNPGLLYNNPPKLGDNTPRWTISRSKRKGDIDRKVPGPGTYKHDVPHDTRIAPSIRPKSQIKDREYYDVPLRNDHEFPVITQKTIGLKTECEFWGSRNTNPGPGFIPKSTLAHHGLTIGEKFKNKNTQDTPGPSDYNPQDARLPAEPLFSVKGPLSRDDWLPKRGNEPGPADYNTRSKNSAPKWIIGERSISRTNRSMSSQREITVLTSRKPKSSLQ